jgi:hypothetical protein
LPKKVSKTNEFQLLVKGTRTVRGGTFEVEISLGILPDAFRMTVLTFLAAVENTAIILPTTAVVL